MPGRPHRLSEAASVEPQIIAYPPFDGWPVQHVFGDGIGLLWLTDPGVICVQILGERGDLTLAKSYVGAVRAIRALYPERTTSCGGVRMLQDFSRLRTVEKDARAYLSDAAGRDFRPKEVVYNKVQIAEQVMLVRIALRLHAAALSRLGLAHFESVTSLGAEMRCRGIVAPTLAPDLEAQRATFAETWERVRDR